MKVFKKSVSYKDQSGFLVLLPEWSEDIWHAYNLIQHDDLITATTFRKVVSTSATGSTSSEKVRMQLQVRVKKVEYEPPGDGGGGGSSKAPAGPSNGFVPGAGSGGAKEEASAILHVQGKVSSPNPHVRMDSFHTLDLEVGTKFTLEKEIGGWDEVTMDRVEESSAEGRGAELGAIVCGEGMATFCLITQHTTIILQRIEVPIPKKRQGAQASTTEKASSKFHSQIYSALLRHFDFDTLKVLIIASPGFVKEAVFEKIMEEATRTNNKTVLTSRPKFILLHSPSHHVHSLTQIISSSEVSSRLSHLHFARESQLLERFYSFLDSDPLRAWYTAPHVKLAIERGAVGTLMIADGIFRSPDPKERQEWVRLNGVVKQFGGEVLIFSSMHESGEQLTQLGGVAAILNFPLDIEIIEEEEREAKEEEEKKKRQDEGRDVETELEPNLNHLKIENEPR